MNTDRPMTGEEFGRLDALERRIQTGWDEAALALAEIKTAKLYRRTRVGQRKQTWDEYCQRVHHITPQWANKLISRARRLKDIRERTETEVSLSPTAVGHLDGLDPELQVEIVQEATKGGQQPTAKQIGEARRARTTIEEAGSGDEEAEPEEDTDANDVADDLSGVDEENAGRWEREVAKAEAEAAKLGDGGTAAPATPFYKVTVMVFSEGDQAAIHGALAKWSPITKSLGGSKQLRTVSANAEQRQIGTLLQRLASALDQNQPRKLRVSIEL